MYFFCFCDNHFNIPLINIEIPSPTRKKGSLSSHLEDCVVPDIDDDDNVFKFDRPNVPSGV